MVLLPTLTCLRKRRKSFWSRTEVQVVILVGLVGVIGLGEEGCWVAGLECELGCGRRKCKVERVLDVVGARELV
jgi:hypothetical protein